MCSHCTVIAYSWRIRLQRRFPVVASINDLKEGARVQYSLDVLKAGDALLVVTGAYRINYETLGTSEPALHKHIIPRFAHEPEANRKMPAMMVYSWPQAQPLSPVAHGALVADTRALLDRSEW